jgi:hypothetical protein
MRYAKLLTDCLERIQVTSAQVLEGIRTEIPEGPFS